MRSRTLIAAAAAAVLTLAAYGNFFHNAFHFDDEHVIVDNGAIRSLANLGRFFTDANTFSSLPSNATYRPLVTLSFALDYAEHHALDPVAFHATQLVLLLLVGALLFVVFRQLFDSDLLAVAAATLFCIHTANTETMNFLSCRSELISALGFLGALIVFIRYPRQRKRGWYLIPLALGALAKAPVVIFAFVVIAWVRLIERKPRVEAVKAGAPSFVVGIVLLVALNAMNSPQWIAGGGSRLDYFLTQPYVWLHYARLALLPAGLSADTDLDLVTHWYDTNAIAGDAFVILLCLAIARLGRTRDTAPIAFGLAWFAITLLPTSSVFPLAEVANEHRMFFPLMGVAAAAAWAVELLARRFPAQQRFAYAALVVAALALALATHTRNRVWRTEETLWRDVTIKSPRNGRGWMNFGLTQMEQARYAEAKDAFDRAATFTPNYGTLEINRGIVASALGDDTTAERYFRRALELHPDRNAHFYYARWLVGRGRGSDAETHANEAAKIAPSWLPPRRLAMQIAVARGDAAYARTAAKAILAIDPTDDEALGVARDAVDKRCGNYRNCFDRAWSATAAKRHVEAAVGYRAAAQYDSTAIAWNNLGWALASMGYPADAAMAYQTALQIDPTFVRAKNNLIELARPSRAAPPRTSTTALQIGSP